MIFDIFNKKQDPFDGIVEVNLKDIKALADKANKLFNEALSKPISAPNNNYSIQQQSQSLRQYAAPQAVYDFTAGMQAAPMQPIPVVNQQVVPPIVPEQNIQSAIYSVQNINTAADVIDTIEKMKNVSLTWGQITGLDILYTISPGVYLIRNKANVIGIHFNINANTKPIKDTKKIATLEALSALVSYFVTLFNTCTSQVAPIDLENSDVYITIGQLKLGIGTLAMIKYVMSKYYWVAGTQVNVDGYLITANDNSLLFQKEGYVPTSVDLNQFKYIVTNVPALNVFELNDDVFRLYQDDPKDLTTRLIVELNKATNKFEVITYEDIATLDSTMGIQIKNSILGKQIKLSENIE